MFDKIGKKPLNLIERMKQYAWSSGQNVKMNIENQGIKGMGKEEKFQISKAETQIQYDKLEKEATFGQVMGKLVKKHEVDKLG